MRDSHLKLNTIKATKAANISNMFSRMKYSANGSLKHLHHSNFIQHTEMYRNAFVLDCLIPDSINGFMDLRGK